MKKLLRALTGVLALSLLASLAGCSKEKTNPDSTDPTTDEIPVTETDSPADDPAAADSDTIYWLADYDLNPAAGSERSTALSLFEEQYHGKIVWVPCAAGECYDMLTQRLHSGDPVDMVPFQVDAMPDGISRELFSPLDEYLDLNDSIWDGMRGAIGMFAYDGKHYAVPYAVSDPLLLTYSRKACSENGLEDPYTLYTQGKWNWDTMLDMMQTFRNKGADRFGIAGWFEQGLLHSTGQSVIAFDGTQFINNIEHPEIAEAEELLSDIAARGLYDTNWYNNYPTSGNVLFYAMGDWSLPASNAKNPDADIMVVPFPMSPRVGKQYYSGNYDVKMLACDSQKGSLVASYILCERTAALKDEYRASVKAQALAGTKNILGETTGFVTEEQYGVIEQYKQDALPIYEFGLGMGGVTMYTHGMYTYETRGVMNNILDGLLTYPDTGDTWETLRDSLSPLIDQELGEYNLQ